MAEKCSRCSGCAFTKGAKANLETPNAMGGLLSALAGKPFICHEKMGWTPDQKCYPGGEKALSVAYSTLMLAPSLIHSPGRLGLAEADDLVDPKEFFAEERVVIGRNPNCGGWMDAVAKLNAVEWYRNEAGRGAALEALGSFGRWRAAPEGPECKELFAEFRESMRALMPHLERAKMNGFFKWLTSN